MKTQRILMLLAILIAVGPWAIALAFIAGHAEAAPLTRVVSCETSEVTFRANDRGNLVARVDLNIGCALDFAEAFVRTYAEPDLHGKHLSVIHVRVMDGDAVLWERSPRARGGQ